MAIKTGMLQTKKEIDEETKEKIDAVYPLSSSLSPGDVAVYEHNKPEACFSLLKNLQLTYLSLLYSFCTIYYSSFCTKCQ